MNVANFFSILNLITMNTQKLEITPLVKKESSLFSRLVVAVGDYFLIAISLLIVFLSTFKYMMTGAGTSPLWAVFVQYIFIIYVLGFALFIPFGIVKGNKAKRTMFWVRIIYLIIWVIFLFGIFVTPAR